MLPLEGRPGMELICRSELEAPADAGLLTLVCLPRSDCQTGDSPLRRPEIGTLFRLKNLPERSRKQVFQKKLVAIRLELNGNR